MSAPNFTVTTAAANGSASINPLSGAWSYTPNADFNGADSFTVRVTDDDGNVATQAISITVTPVNDLPVVTGETLNASEDVTLSFDPITTLLGNDTDLDGDTLSMLTFSQPANGSLSLDATTGKLTYLPDGNYFGNDSFTYTVNDGMGGTADGVALIVIAPVADTPQVANASTHSGILSEPIVITRHAEDGAEVTHFRISGISGGTLYQADGITLINAGDFITVAQGQAGVRFLPTPSNSGNGSFQVEASLDALSNVAGGKATATITVVPTAEPPAIDPGELPGADPVVEEPEPATEPTEQPPETASAEDEPASQNDLVEAAPILRMASPTIEMTRLNADDAFRPDEMKSTASQELKILLDPQVVDALKESLADLDISSLTRESYELIRSSLDTFKEELGKDLLFDKALVSSAVASSIGLSAGYVIWMLKGGSLLASVLSSLPAWQLADPLSILAGRRDEDDDEESLEDIIDEGGQDDDTTTEEKEAETV